MDGIHLLGEWYGCPADTPHMLDAQALRSACLQAVEAAGLTSVGDRFHQFDPHGVTGAVILAESHLAIHTWPELGAVTLDVYVCNFGAENSGKARALMNTLVAAFAPAQVERHALQRGAVAAPAGVAA